ncbi:hypothetical protein, partial [Lonsdalea quercina]|uniref:hypothetical protein n=1 Tax=Lonsdalea quercina TaxID=71657 RepID=UPI001C65C891
YRRFALAGLSAGLRGVNVRAERLAQGIAEDLQICLRCEPLGRATLIGCGEFAKGVMIQGIIKSNNGLAL